MFPETEQIEALLGSTVYVTARPEVDVADSGKGGSYLSWLPASGKVIVCDCLAIEKVCSTCSAARKELLPLWFA